ncbi:carboxypeptidase N subunit 2 [Coccinella septempunctata]|uniref:carboxypeptidase N subunit 2 n=1 Tax=Coccinella septempunctata TaxID=41139 RepID=UPI001D07D59E|nr:carboxypeptidase N subunit 2 [Coccinella septempunctata]
MKLLCLFFTITIFEIVSLRTIIPLEPNFPCPSYCRCDYFEKIVQCVNANLSEVPEKIDTNVTFFTLSHNNFNGIPLGITNLKNLYFLDLSYNPDITVVEVNFKHPSLRNLHMKRCSINYIDNSIFRGFPDLEILNLSGNPIAFVNNTLDSPSLKTLVLSDCRLKYLKPDAFSKLTSLSFLSLAENSNMKQCHSESESLLTLDLSNCSLEHLPTGPLKKVVDLDLRENNIQMLRNKSFAHITSVETLNISFNAIKSIETNSFSRLDRIIVLDLSYNRLTTIEKTTFKKNERLKSLYLSHNYLRKIKGISSDSLELLDLNFCEINSLTQYSLTNLPALTELHLVRNQISHIPDNIEAPHLVYLDISYNDISSLNNATFASLRSLRFLVLSGNKLTTLDPKFFPQVIDLSIEDNPWLCDCEALRQIYFWMIRTDQNMKKLRCQLPVKLEGLTWEAACSSTWSKLNHPKANVWMYSLSFFITVAVLIFLVYVSKKLDQRRKIQADQQAAERLALEREEFVQRQERRARLRHLVEQEVSRNAPDPRESQGPPTYNEALMLPRLDASHPSLAGSLHSFSSMSNSNPDVSKRRRPRRKRRKKLSASQPEVSSNPNLTEGELDLTDIEGQQGNVELEESSF